MQEKLKKAYIGLADVKCQAKTGAEVDREKIDYAMQVILEVMGIYDEDRGEYQIHPRDRDNLKIKCDILVRCLKELEHHHKALTRELCQLEGFKCSGLRGQRPDFLLLEQIVDRIADAVREIRHYMIRSAHRIRQIRLRRM